MSSAPPSRLPLVSTLFLVLAAGVGGVACLPFELVRAWLDSLTGDGRAEQFTPRLYTLLQQIVWLACLVQAGTAVWLWRNPHVLSTGRHFIGDTRRDCWWLVRLLAKVLWRDRWGLVVLTLLGVSLRVPYLSQPMKFDEAYTYLRYASKPFFVGLSLYEDPNNHVLHTFAVHLSTRMLGSAPWAIRLPAFLCGSLLIPLTFMAARLTANRTAAYWAAAVVATSTPLIDYSVNARGYTLVALCTLLGYIAALLLEKGRSSSARPAQVLLILSTVCGLWTIPVMLLPASGLWLWVLHGAFNRKQLLDYAISAAITTVLTILVYLPVLLVSGPDKLLSNPYVTPLEWSELHTRLPQGALAALRLLLTDLPRWSWWMWGLGLTAALATTQNKSGRLLTFPFYLLGAVLVLILIQRAIPPTRTWTAYLPLLAIWTAAGWTEIQFRTKWLNMGWRVLLVAGCIIAPVCQQWQQATIVRSAETGLSPQATEVMECLWSYTGATPQPHFLLTTTPHSAPIRYYAGRQSFPILDLPPEPDELAQALVIVDRASSQTVEQVLREYNLTVTVTNCRPVFELETVQVYDLSQCEMTVLTPLPQLE